MQMCTRKIKQYKKEAGEGGQRWWDQSLPPTANQKLRQVSGQAGSGRDKMQSSFLFGRNYILIPSYRHVTNATPLGPYSSSYRFSYPPVRTPYPEPRIPFFFQSLLPPSDPG